MLRECPDDYDLYAFADQDDIWLEGKLNAAVTAFHGLEDNVPALYYCASTELYSDGSYGKTSFCQDDRANSYKTVLNTFATTQGCTMVFNLKLLKEIRNMDIGIIDMHDSFIHAACLCLGGKIIKDEDSYILYRIHEGQVTGANSMLLDKRIANFSNRKQTRKKSCMALLTSKSIRSECREYLKRLAYYDKNIKYRFSLLLAPCPAGMNNKEMSMFRLKIATGRY